MQNLKTAKSLEAVTHTHTHTIYFTKFHQSTRLYIKYLVNNKKENGKNKFEDSG